jgi:hypothetical protein
MPVRNVPTRTILTSSHTRPRNEKRIPRHEVRPSRYRRAPTIATGNSTNSRLPESTPAATFTSTGASSTSRMMLSRVIGTPKTSAALSVPRSSSRPVP